MALIVYSRTSGEIGWVGVLLLILLGVCIVYSILELGDKEKKIKRFLTGLFAWQKKPPSESDSKYQKRQNLVTECEREFYVLLYLAVGDGYAIFSQVSLNSIIDKRLQGAFRNELFRTIDFVIANKMTSEPLVLVELNDATHKKAERKLRDQKVAEICAAAQMPLVTFWTTDTHSVESVKAALSKYLG